MWVPKDDPRTFPCGGGVQAVGMVRRAGVLFFPPVSIIAVIITMPPNSPKTKPTNCLAVLQCTLMLTYDFANQAWYSMYILMPCTYQNQEHEEELASTSSWGRDHEHRWIPIFLNGAIYVLCHLWNINRITDTGPCEGPLFERYFSKYDT